jgi:hypothetical protein
MKNCTSNGKLPNRLQMTKWVAVAVLALAVTASAQAPVTDTIGAGSPSRTCSYQNTCVAPVLDADGQPTLGTIEVIGSLGWITRRDLEGNILWSSTDYAYWGDKSFTGSNGLRGSLTYTMASKSVRCGGEGRYTYTCTYRWIANGSLAE